MKSKFAALAVMLIMFARPAFAAHTNNRAIYATDIKTSSGTSVFRFPAVLPTASQACVWNADSEPSSLAYGNTLVANTLDERDAQGQSQVWLDSETLLDVHDDFLNATNLTNSVSDWFIGTATGSGSGWTAVTGSPIIGHPGIISFNTGTTNTGYSTFSSANIITFGNSTEWIFDIIFQIPTLSNATDEFQTEAGWNGSWNVAGQISSNGCWLQYDRRTRTTFTAYCANGGTNTSVDTGVTVTAGAWENWRIDVNSAGTAATFYRSGVQKAQITTNIATTAANATQYSAGIVKSAGTTPVSMYIDYARMRAYITGGR